MISKETKQQLVKYALVGFCGGLINMGITAILYSFFDYHFYIIFISIKIDFWVAFFSGCGILVSFLFNFYWNKRWTFKKEKKLGLGS